jgi:hypothetical protein
VSPISRDPIKRAKQIGNLNPLTREQMAGPGNTRSLKHAGNSDRLVSAAAEALVPAIFEANEHLDPARDGPAVYRYAQQHARCLLVYAWLETRADPVFSNRRTGRTHRVYDRLERWERQMQRPRSAASRSRRSRGRS